MGPSTLSTSPTHSQAGTPYSRSPELRVSHKLAERKRRREMKDLFDELRDQLPAERGTKSSKWEILSKAVDHISALKETSVYKDQEIDRLRHELSSARRFSAPAAYAYHPPPPNLGPMGPPPMPHPHAYPHPHAQVPPLPSPLHHPQSSMPPPHHPHSHQAPPSHHPEPQQQQHQQQHHVFHPSYSMHATHPHPEQPLPPPPPPLSHHQPHPQHLRAIPPYFPPSTSP